MSRISELLSGLASNRAFDNFWELTASRLLGRKTGLSVYRLGDWRILVDHLAGDQSGTKECLVTDMYQPFLQAVTLPERPNILDVGGNGGGFSLLCRRDLGPLGQTVSLEFNPDTYRRLWFNLKSNISNEIIVLNAAAAGEDGEIPVADKQGSTSAKLSDGIDENGIVIETVTFDTLVSRYFSDRRIDLCKIDIEGAEFEFLLGDRAESLSGVDNLIIEIHPRSDYLPAQIEEKLASCGLIHKLSADPVHGDVRLYCREN